LTFLVDKSNQPLFRCLTPCFIDVIVIHESFGGEKESENRQAL